MNVWGWVAFCAFEALLVAVLYRCFVRQRSELGRARERLALLVPDSRGIDLTSLAQGGEEISRTEAWLPLNVVLSRLRTILMLMRERLQRIVLGIRSFELGFGDFEQAFRAAYADGGPAWKWIMTLRHHCTEQGTVASRVSAESGVLASRIGALQTLTGDLTRAANAGMDELGTAERDILALEREVRRLAEENELLDVRAIALKGDLRSSVEQAELLAAFAVNVSMELERLADLDEGFGVMAREMRRLAGENRVSLSDASARCEELMCFTERSARDLRRFTYRAASAASGVEGVKAAFSEISSRTGKIGSAIGQAASAVRDLPEAARRLEKSSQTLLRYSKGAMTEFKTTRGEVESRIQRMAFRMKSTIQATEGLTRQFSFIRLGEKKPDVGDRVTAPGGYEDFRSISWGEETAAYPLSESA